METIEPLDELDKREVKKPEIIEIRDKLAVILGEIKDMEDAVNDSDGDTSRLTKDVDALIEQEKQKKIGKADDLIKDLERLLVDLDDTKKDATKKLQKYQGLIEDAQQEEGKEDPQLLGKLNQLEKEAAAIKVQIKDINDKQADIKAKKEEAKAFVDEAYANPDNFVPTQIDGVLDGLYELRDKTEGLNEKMGTIDEDLDQRIKDLEDLLRKYHEAKDCNCALDADLAQMKDDVGNTKELLRSLPGRIADIEKALQEMKTGSLPDDTADYWEEKKDIEKWIASLTSSKAKLEALEELHKKKEANFKNLVSQQRKLQGNLEGLKKFSQLVTVEKQAISNMVESGYDIQDVVNGTRNDMGDC